MHGNWADHRPCSLYPKSHIPALRSFLSNTHSAPYQCRQQRSYHPVTHRESYRLPQYLPPSPPEVNQMQMSFGSLPCLLLSKYHPVPTPVHHQSTNNVVASRNPLSDPFLRIGQSLALPHQVAAGSAPLRVNMVPLAGLSAVSPTPVPAVQYLPAERL